MTARMPNFRITSAWYGSSRLLVVGPAAFMNQERPPLERDRAAVVQQRPLQVDGRVVGHQVMMQRIAPGMHRAVQEDDVPTLSERTCFHGKGRGQPDLASRERRPCERAMWTAGVSSL